MAIAPGTIVIVDSGQAGTAIIVTSTDVHVLLANGDLWQGHIGRVREPQSLEDLAACPLDVEKAEKPRQRKNKED